MKKVFLTGILSLALALTAIPSALLAQPVGGSSAGPLPSTGGTVTVSLASCKTLEKDGFAGVVNCIIAMVNVAIYLLISASVVYIMVGAFNMIRSEENREEHKHTIYYGIIGLFVMVSVWGLVNILVATFGISGTSSAAAIPSIQGIRVP